MDLSTIPAHRPGEALADYLRRVLEDPSVSIGELARHMDINRNALYVIRKGGRADESTITRFGALTGALKPTPETLTLMDALSLRSYADAGWAERKRLLGE